MDQLFEQPLFVFLFFNLLCIIPIFIFSTKPTPLDVEKNVCLRHPERRSTSICHICNTSLCQECVKSHSALSFCFEHYKLLEQYQWKPILSFKVNSEQSNDGVILQDFKEMIWRNEGIPSYIVVEYRINFEEDLIESHLSYFTRIQDQDHIMKRFNSYKYQN